MKGTHGQYDPESRKRYRDNWDRIFGKDETVVCQEALGAIRGSFVTTKEALKGFREFTEAGYSVAEFAKQPNEEREGE